MNDKEITTTLTAPGTVGTAVGRDVWSKILGKNQCGETYKQYDLHKVLSKIYSKSKYIKKQISTVIT